MKKIAFVNQRFGKEVVGGSETLCRILAEKLKSDFFVEILTTCAKDDTTWSNFYKSGIFNENGYLIRRFEVNQKRRLDSFNQIFTLTKNEKEHNFEDEIKWIINQGPYSLDLFEFIHLNYQNYDAIVFMTYLYYSTCVCILNIPNSILMPTAHDEAAIYLKYYDYAFKDVKGIIYNTQSEKVFFEKRFPKTSGLPNFVGCFGIDFNTEVIDFSTKIKLPNHYILYAGRINCGKGCDELFDYFTRFKKNNKNDLKLVLIGEKTIDIPDSNDIIYLGFVSENEKFLIMKNAESFVIFSKHESLSIVLLESLSLGTPAIVRSDCEVLTNHIKESKCGFIFKNYDDFCEILNSLSKKSKKTEMKQNGIEYVKKYYTWSDVIFKLNNLIEKVGYKSKISLNNNVLPKKDEKIKTKISLTVPIILACDDNYVKYLAVVLESIKKHINIQYEYDIMIFLDNVSKTNRNILYKFKNDNVAINFIDISEDLNQLTFNFTNKTLTRSTFSRLLIMEKIKNYEKVIYLDCDVIVLDDLSKLLELNKNDKMICAVRDIHISKTSDYRENFKTYIKNTIGLDSCNNYFNAGVLVINIKKMKEKCSFNDIKKMLLNNTFMWEDQDILNIIAKNDVFYLDYEWNLFILNDIYIENVLKSDEDYLKAVFHPKIFHFLCGTLPTKGVKNEFSYLWWEYARTSPFYEEILKDYIYPNVNISPVINKKKNCFYRLFKSIKKRGLNQTIKLFMCKLKNKLFKNNVK